MPGYTISTENSDDQTITTTTETVIATLTGVSTSGPGRTVRLKGEVKMTTGTATTALTPRIRRDSLTGAITHDATPEQVEVAAGLVESHDIVTGDTLAGEVFNATYVLTIQQTAATADGTVHYAYLEAVCE